jgi:hypothetical protein
VLNDISRLQYSDNASQGHGQTFSSGRVSCRMLYVRSEYGTGLISSLRTPFVCNIITSACFGVSFILCLRTAIIYSFSCSTRGGTFDRGNAYVDIVAESFSGFARVPESQ